MIRKINFRENRFIFLGILGDAEFYFWYLGEQRQNTFRVELRIFRDFGEINALILGSKGVQTPHPWASLSHCVPLDDVKESD